MAFRLDHSTHRVLAKYVELNEQDAGGAWNPYFIDVANAAGGDAFLAYRICKRLGALSLLDHRGRQGTALHSSPGYWPTDFGIQWLKDNPFVEDSA